MGFKVTKDLWTGLGVGLAVFGILTGIGQCERGFSCVDIEKEKTKQLELKVELREINE